MNEELATHISLLAAPIYAVMIANADSPDAVKSDAWRAMCHLAAIRLARELWEATLAT